MPYSNTRKVVDIETLEWVVEGEYHEDTQYFVNQYYVLAVCEGGERYVHEQVFFNELDLGQAKADLQRFVERVEARGYINLKHWSFHEYFSLTLEQKWDVEAEMEDHARHGRIDQIPHNSVWGDYHV
jgi:hypothetical protein